MLVRFHHQLFAIAASLFEVWRPHLIRRSTKRCELGKTLWRDHTSGKDLVRDTESPIPS